MQLEADTLNVPDTNSFTKDSTICGVPWPDFIVVLAGITQLYVVASGTGLIEYVWSEHNPIVFPVIAPGVEGFAL